MGVSFGDERLQRGKLAVCAGEFPGQFGLPVLERTQGLDGTCRVSRC